MSNLRIRNSAVLVLFILTACLCIAAAASAPSLVIGQLVQVAGNVKVDGHKTDAGTTLVSGDVVSTTSSPAVITLSNGQTITIAANSQVQISMVNGQITVTALKGNYSSTNSDSSAVQLAQSSESYDQGCPPSPKCPPGLAKKDPPCVPPGQAKKNK